MIKVAKIALVILLFLAISLFIAIKVISVPVPTGQSGSEADTMAIEMMKSLNIDAWKNTDSVSWTFKDAHRYNWNISDHHVLVQWEDIVIKLNHQDGSGLIKESANSNVSDAEGLIKKSLDYFNNDSFWLYAPFKAFDSGTTRSIVTLKDGRKGLKITYSSGGSTPGDSYVWILGDDNKPIAVKMWVSIIPIGGIEFTWENYIKLPSGALIAQDHWLYDTVNISLTEIY